MTAKQFITALNTLQSDTEIPKVIKYFHGNDGLTKAMGVRFGDIFKVAKAFEAMPLTEVNKLLDNKYYEVRMGAVAIMDYQAKSKKTSESQRKALFDLYIDRHDRLNNWDFVDRAAHAVIGQYLLDKPRKILYKLAKSKDPWERRTAIVATYPFLKKNELDDTFAIAAILLHDKHELVNKAVGSWLRVAGQKDLKRLSAFLDTHAASMPRESLRYAIEKMDKQSRERYLGMKKSTPQKS